MCHCRPTVRTPCCGPSCCKLPGGCGFCTPKPSAQDFVESGLAQHANELEARFIASLSESARQEYERFTQQRAELMSAITRVFAATTSEEVALYADEVERLCWSNNRERLRWIELRKRFFERDTILVTKEPK